ncbi:DivIVA domain-containing protein [Terrabacter sp. NPDC080008]|uniref:DivIVA domain-containing protein n=1 Tax=Terrabacter sp. NPDC080008 TaxID=3155176 RepID=UPI00344E71F4
MDRAALADELRRARFHTTQFREGYEESAVDDLIDAIVARLLSPGADSRADADLVAMVQNAWIPTTKARRGYAQADVDAVLDRLVTTLGGAQPEGLATAPVASTAGTAPVAELPSAVTEPRRGLLSRLLGG